MQTEETIERPLKARAAAELLLDEVDCALLACSAAGRLEHANRAARQLLRAGVPMKLHDGLLRVAPDSAAAFGAALATAALERRSTLVQLEPGEPQALLLASPGAAGGAGPAVLLMLGRSALCSPLGLELLATRHALTQAEKRVLRALLANRAVRCIASDHGVSVSTVRTQVLSIRAKIGVRSIEALMLRAARLPPVAGLPGLDGH